ncbi:hypothetical protein H0R92_10250 [Treponema sp. OMZ 840]|uniref:hypothetical protein n=1 Tax=Treponema sp. OMZ 840 TaxID=244313 RepID=UPI003D928C61
MSDERYIEKCIVADLSAEKIIQTLLSSKYDIAIFKSYLKEYLLTRFMLNSNIEEENIYNLAVMSIKANLSDKSAESLANADLRIDKYDCHHTNSAVRKKVLFIMNLEKKLNIHLPDDAAVEINNIEDLALLLYPKYMQKWESNSEYDI